MATTRLPVVLLWHMHQPHYRDALTGRYVLPWTYLHAIKDYIDMAAHVEANPRARAVFNFTPVLIEQLEELAGAVSQHLERGVPLPDPVLALLGPEPVPSVPAERLELVRACLRAHRGRLIERFAPYLELARLAEGFATLERIGYASDQFVRDLAVWYHIAWLGETVRRDDAFIAALEKQGRDFAPEQQRQLLERIRDLLAGIVPRYRRLAESGRCELSVTPYGHPIVPLMLDFHAARESAPATALPHHPRYPGGADRARWHVEEGLRVFTRAFGVQPLGCWPSEGAISRATIELLADFGFRWIASSSNVLRASLDAGQDPDCDDERAFNRPYRLPHGGPACFFREDAISDLIGFTYATWHGDDAAAHLVAQLERLVKEYDGHTAEHAVLIALDGENAWEHYPFNGYYFLAALYRLLAEHPALELVTLSDCVARGIPARPLPAVIAGSWVHGTLATWMGDAAKNAGWDLLCEAKQAFDRTVAAGGLDAQRRRDAERQLALCESSDWFWWFGDYNPQEAVGQFDRLYRRQLVNLYRLLDVEPPARLSQPISAGAAHGGPEHGGVMRRAFAD
jgi:alpha-amylase/alpha-mannosidase (GH57 family)